MSKNVREPIVKKKPRNTASPTVRRGSGAIYPASMKPNNFLISDRIKMGNCSILQFFATFLKAIHTIKH